MSQIDVCSKADTYIFGFFVNRATFALVDDSQTFDKRELELGNSIK